MNVDRVREGGEPTDPGPHTVGLYVHVPICARACPYCDFDFNLAARTPIETFVAPLRRELLARRGELSAGVDTLYVGGGTPSALGIGGWRALDQILRDALGSRAPSEFTVELNPEHVEGAWADALLASGVNRVSLGVQTFAPEGLRQLGRAHDRVAAEASVACLVEAGLRVSVDLMVGWTGQSAECLREDVARVVDLGCEHVSIYALTIEAGTAWPKLVRRGVRSLPDEDVQADRLEQASRWLGDAGFDHYEIASYARPGARARHNERYWTWADYVGVGPSAASARYDAVGAVTRRTNVRGLAAWSAGGGPQVETLDPAQSGREALWLGLRRLEGVDLDDLLARFPALEGGAIRARLQPLVARGVIAWSGTRVHLTATGWLHHDEVGRCLL